jgi:hypothetical protein
MPYLAAVDRQDWTMAKSASSSRVRQQPPEVRCWTLTGLMSRPAWLLGEPDGQIGGELQDHVLVVAEAAGQPQAAHGGLGVAVLVAGDALGDGAAVPGGDPGQLIVAEAMPARDASGGGCGAGTRSRSAMDWARPGLLGPSGTDPAGRGGFTCWTRGAAHR